MKPGLGALIAGVLLFVVAFIVPVCFVLLVVFGKSDEVQFEVPGKLEFDAREAGKYYLWNDYRTVYKGKSYDRSRNIPDGIDITVSDASGQLQFVNDSSTSVTSGSTAAVSIGYVQVEKPEKLTIEVSGAKDDRIFSFAESRLKTIIGYVIAGLVAAMFVGLVGLALIITGIIKLVRSK
jgi:hypothetical protein